MKFTISRIIKRYSNIPHVKPIQAKGLRHSHASLLINKLNVSVLILSKRLGHSSPEITLKHYSHLWDSTDEVITNEMVGIINVSFPSSSLVNFNGNQSISN
jgi:integrase